jgi:nitrate reductase gamma subunit
VEAWLEFGRGPLFRLCFALMVFGLLRILILTAISMWEAYDRSPDKILPWRELTAKTFGWLLPFRTLWRKRPVYSVISFLFHIGILLVPPFLAAHILLWNGALGLAWLALPQPAADWLTVLVIVTGTGLFAGRLFHGAARSLSRKQDYMWPLLIMVPFVTGYFCSNVELAPRMYQRMMLFHVWSGNLIMLLLPFTKIAHCVLLPLSQYVTGLAWKFPAGAGQRVVDTLGYGDRPTWVERPRLATDRVPAPTEEA